MKNRVFNMKALIPFLTFLLVGCGVHHHRYDADQDAYYQSDYYAYDNYDPYYGYGSNDYSVAGDGVYYNNYNYYPDRWGMTYSNAYYSPYRYPRVGFYYSSYDGCGYGYLWSNWCSFGHGPSAYYSTYSWLPTFGFGLSFSSYYYDNYWWYNHWRHRNYYHNTPTQHGYYSARNEVRRLNTNRYQTNKAYRSGNRTGKYTNNNRRAVNRGRSSSNRPVNRSYQRSTTPRQSSQSNNRDRQQQASSGGRYNNSYTPNHSSARSEAVRRSSGSSLQQQIRLNHAHSNAQTNNQSSQRAQQGSARIATQMPTQRNRTYVKPLNTQQSVYQSNKQPQVNTYDRSQAASRNTYLPQSNVSANNNRSQLPAANRTRSATSNRAVVTPKPATKVNKSSHSSGRNKHNNTNKNKSSTSASRSNNRSRQR